MKRAGRVTVPAGTAATEAAKVRAAKQGWPSPLVAGAVGSTVGGENDAIRNTGDEEYNFTRIPSQWRGMWFETMKAQFNHLLETKGIEQPERYCLKSLADAAVQHGHKTCQSRICNRKHEIPADVVELITMDDLNDRKKLLLFYCALWGGPKLNPNAGSRITEFRPAGDMTVKQLQVYCEKLRNQIVAEDAAEDTDSEPEEDASHVDGFDNVIVARHPGSIVGAGKNKGIPVSPAEDSAKTAVPKLSETEKAKQVKNNELFVSPDGKLAKTKKQGSMGVADANRAHFDNVVAPTLLPPDLAQFRSLSTPVTYARLGSVAVLNQFDALVKF